MTLRKFDNIMSSIPNAFHGTLGDETPSFTILERIKDGRCCFGGDVECY